MQIHFRLEAAPIEEPDFNARKRHRANRARIWNLCACPAPFCGVHSAIERQEEPNPYGRRHDMKTWWHRSLTFAVLVSAALAAIPSRAQSPDEFQKRRQAIREAMDPDSVLVLRSAAVVPETRFRQESNLFYLTGIDEPGVSLILYSVRREAAGGAAAGSRPAGGPQTGGRAEALFAPPTVPDFPAPAGTTPPVPAPPSRPGFTSVRPAADFQSAYESALLATTGTVYVDMPRVRSLSAPLSADEQWFRAARDRGADFKVKPAASLFGTLRLIKSTDEIAVLKKAAEITAAAEREAMRSAKPGMFEYQIQSIIEHVFAFNGAIRPGFSTIVGSGRNSCILHWSENTRKTGPGDLIVLDIGAELNRYTADITRTIPISGTFTPRQRDIYEIVLKANEEAIKMVGPNVNMADVNARVNEVLAEGLIRVGLIQDKSGLRQYYTHGLSHSIGLDVHDLGGALTTGVLKPGMVITIEPGLYIPAENLGIRIEDDVLVTPAGYEVITSAAPKSAAEVEKLMKEPGMDPARYTVKK
jgi:Xaa-Pro aminopeptidase